ncbi:MAG: bacterial Ig-like domain-containing protein [Paludibacteraceae bacterium]|nr:bacterial Ig-like domain-containing protein [Paludibacteraceae bacterium]
MKKLTLLLSAMLLACATNLWAAEPVTVTKTVDDLVKELNWTVSAEQKVKCYKSFKLDENITVSTSGKDNCGSVWGTTNRDWRLYQKQKGDVTITAAEGYSINSITLTYGNKDGGILLNGTTTCKSATAITVNDNNITLTVGNSTNNATKGQVRITKFSVTYVAASSAAKLESLAITGEPTKKEYIVDERFDVTGLTVTATYSDGNTADVTGTVDWLIAPETFTTTGENLSVNVSASMGDVKSNVVTINNIKVRNLYNYAITWKVNGEAYTTGEPTTTVVEGNKITVLPTAPADNSLSCTNAFVGWSTTDLGSEAGQAKPADLFTKVEKAPVPTGDMTFYAVFATGATTENAKLVDFTSGGKSALAEIAGITTYDLGSDYSASANAPYIVKFDDTNDYIIWENINLSKVDSVTFGVKMIGGSDKSTMTVLTSEDGTTYTKVQACVISGNKDDILSFKVPIAATPAFIKLNFTKGSNVGFGNFVIYGTGITYADYRTACGTTPSAIDNATAETPAVKTIENGQLVIIRDGVKYNAMGVRLQ